MSHRLAGLLYRLRTLPDLYQRHGAARMAAEARGRLGRLVKRSKPLPSAPLDEQAVRRELDDLLHLLELPGDSSAVLAGVSQYFGSGARLQLLTHVQAIASHRLAASVLPEYPVIQASALPPDALAYGGRRILFITGSFPSPRHGGGNRILNFLKLLAQKNEIYLASAFIKGEDEAALQVIKPYCRSVLCIPFQSFGDNREEIHRWLAGRGMDIVHYEWPRSLAHLDPSFGGHSIFTYMEAVALRLRMDLDGLPPGSPAWFDIFSSMIAALRAELVDAAAADARIAVTTKDAEFFRRLQPHQQYTVLNHGLTFSDFSLPDAQPEPLTLVFAGNFAHYPNLDAMRWFFASVWPEIRRDLPEARVLLVGNRPPRAIRDLADGQQVVVTGGVPDVRPYIQKAVVCIAPLVSGAGLRGKVIEYAALRRPFVATSIAVEDLVFQDDRDFLRADTAQDFAQSTIALLRDPQRARRMAASAYETARSHYDTPQLVEFLERFYSYLASGS
jgi:glycosyltransferase involved in cell wall biosynthesis